MITGGGGVSTRAADNDGAGSGFARMVKSVINSEEDPELFIASWVRAARVVFQIQVES